MQRTLSPSNNVDKAPPASQTLAEQSTVRKEADQYFLSIIHGGGVDQATYEDFRWQLARHVGCSVEGLDEVLARFMLKFNMRSVDP